MAIVKITGIDEMFKNMDEFKSQVRVLMSEGVFEGCRLIQNDAKEGHHEGAHSVGRYQNRTGALTNSIDAKKPEIGFTHIIGEVVAGMDYAANVELGGTYKTKSGKTYRTRPYPFLFPALEKYSQEIVKMLQDMIKQIKWVN